MPQYKLKKHFMSIFLTGVLQCRTFFDIKKKAIVDGTLIYLEKQAFLRLH